MKKLYSALCIILAIPMIFCSCSLFASSQAESITISSESLSLLIGDSSELTTSISPEDVSDKSVTWSSSDENVATVTTDGTVKGVGEGTAIITAMTDNGVKDECNVTVNPIEVTSVTLDSENASVTVGKKIELTAKVLPTNATDTSVEWSSSDESVAVVSSSGFVTGVKAGVASISCTTGNGKKASCTVTVKSSTESSDSAEESTDSTDSTSESTQPSESESSDSSSGSSSSSDSSEYMFADSSTRKLSESEVSSLSASEAQYAINEIYARNGYVFKTDSIQSYFESKSWYHADSSFTMNDLNETERYNVSLLTKYR